MPKQFHEQRNGRRTDPPDDFKGLPMEVFIAAVEESSQQRQRTPRPLDQGGFGNGPDLQVLAIKRSSQLITWAEFLDSERLAWRG